MRKFEFPLRSVLRLRRFAEAQARQALMEAVADLRVAEEALAATRREIGVQLHSLQDRLPAMQAAEVANAWRQLELLEYLALKQARAVADGEAVVAERQAAYQAAQRDRKPLERLEEEMRRMHYHAAELVEQAMTDELAVIGHSRKGAGP